MQGVVPSAYAQLHIAAAGHRQLLAITRRLDHLVVKGATGEIGRIEKTRQSHGRQNTDQQHGDDQFDQGETAMAYGETSHGQSLSGIQQEQGISLKNIQEIHDCKIAEIRKQYGVFSGRVATVY
jgi:hypothetical protein